MPSMEIVNRFLAQEHVAFVGVSRDPKDFANSVYRQLRRRGRTLYPVNDAAGGAVIEGDRSYRRLSDIPHPIDGVIIMVAPARAAGVVRDAVASGVPRVWLHRGIGRGAVSDEALALCHDHDVEVVDGACPLMFEEPVTAIHRLHRFVVNRRFAA